MIKISKNKLAGLNYWSTDEIERSTRFSFDKNLLKLLGQFYTYENNDQCTFVFGVHKGYVIPAFDVGFEEDIIDDVRFIVGPDNVSLITLDDFAGLKTYTKKALKQYMLDNGWRMVFYTELTK